MSEMQSLHESIDCNSQKIASSSLRDRDEMLAFKSRRPFLLVRATSSHFKCTSREHFHILIAILDLLFAWMAALNTSDGEKKGKIGKKNTLHAT